MATAIGSYSYNNIIGSIRTKLKQFTDEKYPKATIKDDIYRAICELTELSGTKNEPIYRGSQIIPLAKSVQSNASAGVTYEGSTRYLTVPLASTNANNVWTNDTDGFDSSWEGADVRIEYNDGSSGDDAPNAPNTSKQITIGSGASDAQLVGGQPTKLLLPSGFMTGTLTLPTHPIIRLTIVLSNQAVLDTINISGISDYKYIDRITAINDSVNGLCLEVPEKDFWAIKKYSSAENDYRDSVIWYRAGEYIYFNKNSLSAYGVRTMHYTRMPIKPTTYTEYVDYPDSQTKMLIDIVVTGILQSLNVQLPQDLASVANKLQALRQATAEERAKAESNFKTQA